MTKAAPIVAFVFYGGWHPPPLIEKLKTNNIWKPKKYLGHLIY